MEDEVKDGGAAIKIDSDTIELAKQALMMAHHMLSQYDWKAWIEECQRAHSVGHILHPTAYRDALFSGRLESNEAFARAAHTFVSELNRLAAREGRDG
ncbi:MAG TPA: hypothetical protein DCL54_03370 [Alphaproteobacteria bacterium]|nr:hypothetical protein [Alphaproteobacteria bacterium]